MPGKTVMSDMQLLNIDEDPVTSVLGPGNVNPVRTACRKRMTLVTMSNQCSTSELLARAALVHHTEPSGVSQLFRVFMMLECSTGK